MVVASALLRDEREDQVGAVVIGRTDVDCLIKTKVQRVFNVIDFRGQAGVPAQGLQDLDGGSRGYKFEQDGL
jgi:hypothetical protein